MSVEQFDLPDDFERRVGGTGVKVPDLIGVAEGWRAWKVKIDLPPYGLPPRLYSVVHDYFWAPRKAMRAECDRGHAEHVPGDEACGCGFYSAKSRNHLIQMGYHNWVCHDREYMQIIGRVANWGKVIEGTAGWRAEWAYPLELFVPFEHLVTHGKRLRDGYGVPVRPMNVIEAKIDPDWDITQDFPDRAPAEDDD